jgi:serine/threonine protein kinase
MSPADGDKTAMPAAASAARSAAGAAVADGGESVLALPVGTRLHEFEITGVIGEGGFGVVYAAHDHSLDRAVAVKEYMPGALAHRTRGVTVSVRSERHRETFQLGLKSFVNEAKLLARFDHPSLVKVYRFWEANGTAYMAMPHYHGETLKSSLKALSTAPDEAWLRTLLDSVLDALAVIHGANVYHRDIAPDNIMLLDADVPVLLDFGAARRVIRDATQGLTVILKPGYAPIEQYAEVKSMKQSAWTDLYALAATVYISNCQRQGGQRRLRKQLQPDAAQRCCAGRISREHPTLCQRQTNGRAQTGAARRGARQRAALCAGGSPGGPALSHQKLFKCMISNSF